MAVASNSYLCSIACDKWNHCDRLCYFQSPQRLNLTGWIWLAWLHLTYPGGTLRLSLAGASEWVSNYPDAALA